MDTTLKNTISVEQIYDQPLKFVWEAWTDPAHIKEWWAPQGINLDVIEYDFNEGGEWVYDMHMENGQTMKADGVFQKIEEYERILTSANFRPNTIDMYMEILFESIGDQTKVTLHGHHATEEEKKAQEDLGFKRGWTSTFDRLGKYLNSYFL